jgi:hypothetical protein
MSGGGAGSLLTFRVTILKTLTMAASALSGDGRADLMAPIKQALSMRA